MAEVGELAERGIEMIETKVIDGKVYCSICNELLDEHYNANRAPLLLSHKCQLILFGAGSAGRETLRYLRSKGIEPMSFMDNDSNKWNTVYEGLKVFDPVADPKATYVATVYGSRAKEVREQLKEMGVKTAPLSNCLEMCNEFPNAATLCTLLCLVTEKDSLDELYDQIHFRLTLDYDHQRSPSDISELYFPDWIKPLPDEVYVDCGAADGDTVREFVRRRKGEFKQIHAFEPDARQYAKIKDYKEPCYTYFLAVSGENNSNNRSVKLDSISNLRPTYIKMDIEGDEFKALWGAVGVIRKHMPVLAICAYHKPRDLWEIPLLIHLIEPEYELRLRRYAEGDRELVWYAIPKERLNG